MVYAEVVLKKEVDWTTIPAMTHVVHQESPTIAHHGENIDWKKMLSKPKPGKSLVPDMEVVWLDMFSSDEHTHEYDGYAFDSDHADVVMHGRGQRGP